MANDSVRENLVALLPQLKRFALTLATSPDEADDLVQTACEKALLHADDWRPGTRMDSWLYRIIQNTWIDWYRSPIHRRSVGEEEIDRAGLSVDIGTAIEARFLLVHVDQAIRLMPSTQRTVLVLAGFRGMSHQECARALNIPVGTVMSRLARARSTLARRLSQE